MNPFNTLDTQMRAALVEAGVTVAIGGYDISMNEHEAGVFPRHWKPHAWIFVPETEIIIGKKAFRSSFPIFEKEVPKPVMIKHWDGDIRAIAYALKGHFQRRVSLLPVQESDGTTKKRRNVRYRQLRAHQKVELLIMLDRIGLHRRVFLHGIEMCRERNAVWIGPPGTPDTADTCDTRSKKVR